MTKTRTEKIASVENLTVSFKTENGLSKAVDDVSLDIYKGEVLGLVGESGSGKSVTARSLMRLNPDFASYDEASKITLYQENGALDVLGIQQESDMRAIRGGDIGMIFQEPMASFAPAITIGQQMVEALLIHTDMNAEQAKNYAIEMLDMVGILEPQARFNNYAFELSGGMLQRAMIATAMSTKPKLLIADEPTTALDVTLQAQVLDLMRDLVREFDMGILFITHDLGVIAEMADRVSVMRKGRIVEEGHAWDIIKNPQHNYTKTLIDAIPKLDGIVTLAKLEQHRKAYSPVAEAEEEKTHTSLTSSKPIKDSIVDIDNLDIQFVIDKSLFKDDLVVHAARNVSIQIERGSFCGLVGESGSGKTTLGRAILGGSPITNGTITFNPKNGDSIPINTMNKRQKHDLRVGAQMIFQDPYSSLSPRMSVRDIVAEPLECLGITRTREETDQRVLEMIKKCGLEAEHLRRYPHAFSGGQRQRIAIARALVSHPELVVADESVAALDVSIQAQVLQLLKSLQREMHFTFLFISHDLSVIANYCDDVMVMKHGKLIEIAEPKDLFNKPKTNYTKRLISSIPNLSTIDKRFKK